AQPEPNTTPRSCRGLPSWSASISAACRASSKPGWSPTRNCFESFTGPTVSPVWEQNQCNTSSSGVVFVHFETKQTTIELVSTLEIVPRPSITIIGGGPGGYEAALVASKFGAEVTLIERNGIGGSAVLTDVVPSKTLIASADSRRRVRSATNLGLEFDASSVRSDIERIDRRLLRLAAEQSEDIRRSLQANGVRIMMGE